VATNTSTLRFEYPAQERDQQTIVFLKKKKVEGINTYGCPQTLDHLPPRINRLPSVDRKQPAGYSSRLRYMEQGAAVAVVREPEIPTEAFAEVVESAIKLMGSKERAMRWLGTPVPALNYATPISLLDKPEGKDAVLGVLHRAEYGVF